MDKNVKNEFLEKFSRFFPKAELPISFYYSDKDENIELVTEPNAHQCFIGVLSQVRKGTSLQFNTKSLGCGGAKRYLGFERENAPGSEYFLSCGIPGQFEGLRYKKSPELVKESTNLTPDFEAPAEYISFKRFDKIELSDNPAVIIFFARPDVLAGLFTLALFDEADPHSVLTPWGAGCATIVQYPYLQGLEDNPKCVLGMFDISARPYVSRDIMTFAVPMKKFEKMVGNIEKSFLSTASWEKIKNR